MIRPASRYMAGMPAPVPRVNERASYRRAVGA